MSFLWALDVCSSYVIGGDHNAGLRNALSRVGRPILAVMLCAGCGAPPLPKAAVPTLISGHPQAVMILIGDDISDDVSVCVSITSAMQFERLSRDAMICGATVGELREQFNRLGRAD